MTRLLHLSMVVWLGRAWHRVAGCMAMVLILAAILVSNAWAATMMLPGTGFDASGNAIGNYGVDGNWTVSGSQYGGSAAYVIMPGDPDWWTNWGANTAANGWLGSSWVNNNNLYDDGGSVVPYTYTMSFSLAGFQLNNNLQISGYWGIDDTGTLAINGHAIQTTNTAWGDNPRATFSLSYAANPAWFSAGTNVVTITMTGTDNIREGVRLEGTITGDSPVPRQPWNGGGTNDNWTTPANWGGWTPMASNELIFGPATHVSNHNDFPADTQFNGITFRSDAATYILSGNRLKQAGPLVNNSPATQTIALNLVLEAGGGSIDAAAGDIVLSGTVNGSVTLVKQGVATLTLANTVSPPITVEQGQVVAAPGSLVNGDLTIAAAARFENAGGTVSLQNLTNSGTFAGNARVGGTLANQSAGSMRIGAGQKILVLGTSAHSNAGQIEALGNPYVLGGQAEFECVGPLTNAPSTGMITGRTAVLRFSGGLTNQGSLGLSYGLNDVMGDVNNTGNISVAGGANVTFHDDVIQNGSLVVSAVGATRSTAVFFGSFSGSGGFTGGGDVFLMGDLRPGNSPAEVTFGGNVFMGGSTDTVLELGGLLAGSQYDKMDVIGDLVLDGSLDVVLIDGFAPKAGDTFDLFDGSMSGEFASIALPSLADGLTWNTSNLYTTGSIGVVPEPSTLVLLLAASGALLGYGWRKCRAKRLISIVGVFCVVCLGGVVGAKGATVIRCDFQSSNTHDGLSSVNFVGVESQANAAHSVFASSGSNTWNYLTMPSAYHPTVNPSFSNLVASTGTTTSVGISFTGTTGAAIDDPIDTFDSNGLENDYFVINAPQVGIPATAGYSIHGLPANAPVTMALYAPNFSNMNSINPVGKPSRSFTLTANGSVIQVPSGPSGSFHLATITSDSSGQISGNWTTNGNEGNWSGIQLAYTVPEPSTLALLGIGAIGLLGYGCRKRRTSSIVAVFCAVCLAGVLPADAVTYNARQDFTTTNNPSGAWSYGWSYSLGGGMTMFPHYGPMGEPGLNWHDDSHLRFGAPSVWSGEGFSWAGFVAGPNDICFHPGFAGDYGIIRWTAPEAGSGTVSALFNGYNGGPKDVYVYQNTTKLFTDYLDTVDTLTSYASPPLSLQAGDRIDFAVGPHGVFDGDGTALAAVITFTPIPEPSSLALLAIGGLGLVGWAWRRRSFAT